MLCCVCVRVCVCVCVERGGKEEVAKFIHCVAYHGKLRSSTGYHTRGGTQLAGGGLFG